MGAMVGGTASIEFDTSSDSVWIPKVVELYRNIVNPNYKIRRVFVNANNIHEDTGEMQLNFFTASSENLEKEKRLQETLLKVKSRYGKNAILKGMDYTEKAMTKIRNGQIGGHKSGEETDSPNGRI